MDEHRRLRFMPALGAALTLFCGAVPVAAQLPSAPVLTIDAARQVAAAAEEEAQRNGWNVVITIVDAGGHLVHAQRLDGVQTGSVDVAMAKARSAALFRRPTKAFSDAVAEGRTALLALPAAVPIEGGEPLLVGDHVVGAIGVSGVTAAQDGQIARAGAAALADLPGAPEPDDEAIRDVIERAYIGGIHRNEARAVAREGFHPEFIMFVRGDGDAVSQVPIEDWLARLPAEGTAPAHSVRARIRVLERQGTTASARAEVFFDDRHVFTDFFLLYRVDGEWRIVGKTFHRHGEAS